MDRLEAAYFEIPVITRTWATLILIVSLLCHFNVISPFHLVFATHFIWKRMEYWRLFSSFFYFGSFGIDFLFHVFFLTRYCRLLEQGSFRNRPADFLWMLLYSSTSIVVLAWFLLPNKLELLSSPMTFVIVYIWSRRNPFIRMNFLGVLNFQAPYLPWILLGFGALLHGIPWNDLLGALVGHVYWYFEDIYPRLQANNGTNIQGRSTRRRIFQAPRILYVNGL
ncbi:hypothetical protein HMI54_007482 [Coelomomyces lativittatus]|nr:hypothetical protein HMI56_002367 [Coelomomyces lativittatus]KAJ1503895.1 hypothetical protein HMI55_002269 [Coelomomyces lativittatus]KAJ1504051.1 hypothetical protein HMI54_007482 [Coelomomyces lativittatus]